MNATSELPLTSLRSERRRVSQQVDRLAWLRRLVVARSDLEVARLLGVTAEAAELDPVVQQALALGTPSGPDLLHALAGATRRLDDAGEAARADLERLTEELVGRLASDPTRCLAG